MCALAVVALPASWRRWLWPLAAVAVPSLMLWTWGSYRPLATALGTGAAVAVSILGAGQATRRLADRGAWAAAAVIGLGLSALLLLTGSVRLSQEAALVAAPMLALIGRPMDADGAFVMAMLLVAAAWGGVLLSSMGYAALIPALCLAALPLGRRRGWLAPLAAAGIGLVLSAPIVIRWVQNPPF